ncbi:class I SAM-dependent methyltransferase [Photobacterium leiognathi]|uniref:class I SAM-dependent methyltransferase n=1 Tax=Photobacterium leiognathi TaxID=553611 RepID=UPI0029812662|nr:class I SAM-dependent methyltransferase [Photobacterium leiognathi]
MDNLEHVKEMYLNLDGTWVEECRRLDMQNERYQALFGSARYSEKYRSELQVISRCADFGCGSGSWSRSIVKEYHNCIVDSVDQSKEAIAYLDSFKIDRINTYNNDIFKFLKSSKAQYDLINLRWVLCTLESKDRELLIKELHDRLYTGGVLQVSEGGRSFTNNKPYNRLGRYYMDACYATHLLESREESDEVQVSMLSLVDKIFGETDINAKVITFDKNKVEHDLLIWDFEFLRNMEKFILDYSTCSEDEFHTLVTEADDFFKNNPVFGYLNFVSVSGKKI